MGIRRRLTFGALYLLRHLLKKNDLLENWKRKHFDKAIAGKLGDWFAERHEEIPRFRASEITPENFTALRKIGPFPFVMEGFAESCEARRKWSIDFFSEKYGQHRVPIRQMNKRGNNIGPVNRIAPLNEIVSDIKEGKITRKYLDNESNIFHRYPELERQLPIEQIKNLIQGDLWDVQLFLGDA